MATGLLIICTGKFTKKITELQGQIKTYTGTISIGKTTPSYDLETEFDAHFDTERITEKQLLTTTELFIGDIQQRPPVFSALKKEGKRLYEYARAGEAVEIPTRQVSVHSFKIAPKTFPAIEFEVVCSKGTYIRSLAHDYGKALESGAHLSSLTRTKIGDFNVNNAIDAASFKDLLEESSSL